MDFKFIPRLFGFRPMVRIPRKNFYSLTQSELATLIEEYVFRNDNLFDRDAIYEFIAVPNKKKDLEAVRAAVLEIVVKARTKTNVDGLETKLGKKMLLQIATNLRNGKLP